MKEIEVMGRKQWDEYIIFKTTQTTQTVEQSAELWKSHLISPVQIVKRRRWNKGHNWSLTDRGKLNGVIFSPNSQRNI